MNLRKHLLDRNLKWNWDEIASYCTKNPVAIRQIVDCCLDENVHVQQNSGAVIGKLIDYDKNILDPFLNELVGLLGQPVHDAVKRGIMRVFQWAEIPEDTEGELFEFVIGALRTAETAIAIKAFGITVARRICEKYPELSGELIPYLEIILDEQPSAGLVSRARHEIKKLRLI